MTGIKRIAMLLIASLIAAGVPVAALLASTATPAEAAIMNPLPSPVVLSMNATGECRATVFWAVPAGPISAYIVEMVYADTKQPVTDALSHTRLLGSSTYWLPGTNTLPTLNLPGAGDYRAKVTTVAFSGTTAYFSTPAYTAQFSAWSNCAPQVIGFACSGGSVTTTFAYAAGKFSAQSSSNATGVLTWSADSSNGGRYADIVRFNDPSRGVLSIPGLTGGRTYRISAWVPINIGWAQVSSASASFTTPNC